MSGAIEAPSATDSSTVSANGRKPWVAFVAALLAPGLGHLYVGATRSWVAAVGVETVALTLVVWMCAKPFGSWIPFALAPVIALGVPLGMAAHAARLAPRGSPIVRPRWLRLGFYILYMLILAKVATTADLWVRQNVGKGFKARAASMFPSLWEGDYFLADMSNSDKRDLKRGDIIVFTVVKDGEGHVFPADKRPDLPRESFVKRILGLPGDSIEFRGNEVILNDQPLAHKHIGRIVGPSSTIPLEELRETLDGHSYTICLTPDRPLADFPRLVVPPDRVFLAGDNRDASFDSRFCGTIRKEEVMGTATHIYFARDPRTGEIHWDRVGRVIQ